MTASFNRAPTPPVAERRSKTDIVHGDTRVDDYYYLREKGSADVTAYLGAENAYSDAVLAPLADLRQSLYDEMLARVQETDLSVPYRNGAYLYYTRTEEGKQYPIRCREPFIPSASLPPELGEESGMGASPASSDPPSSILMGEGAGGRGPTLLPTTLLDLNLLAENQPFLSVGAFNVSDDANLLLYSTDTTGFREYTLRVKDLRTGELLPDTIEKVGRTAWAADNQTFFYTTEDAAKRSYRIYRHRLGDPVSDDTLVYEDLDGLYHVAVRRSLDKTYLFFASESSITTEVRFLPSDDPTGELVLIRPREDGHEYYPEHRDGVLYIRTNDNAINFRLVTAPVASPSDWTELIAHRPDIMLDDHDVYADHLVLTERVGGLPVLRIRRFADGETYEITFPEPSYEVRTADNYEYDTQTLRFEYVSLITPLSVFDYDLNTRERILRKETPVRGGYDPAHYVSEYQFAPAADGTPIPISLVRRRDTPVDGTAPLLLNGYGSYGLTSSPVFRASRLTLLDRGFVFAIAHIRGGGEFGKPWHDSGKMRLKWNTFDDFIACAEYVVREKLAAPDRLAIQGGSAGGLLMGAVVNKRPELFHAVLSIVPFVDVINTMLDETLPLTIGEYVEWGNPHIAADYTYMKTYCPYTNLHAGPYPAMLVRTSINDSQVMYWEPAKYVARLRTLKSNPDVPLLLHINMAAGHGGSSGRYDALRETALDYAFLLTVLGT